MDMRGGEPEVRVRGADAASGRGILRGKRVPGLSPLGGQFYTWPLWELFHKVGRIGHLGSKILPGGIPSAMTSAREHDAATAQAEEEEIRLGWRMAGLAFVMSSEAAAGALIGLVIDHFAGTSQWLLIGGVTGIAVGLLSFARGAMTLNRMVAQQEQSRRARGIPPPAPLPYEDEKDEDVDDADRERDDWK